MPQKKNPDIAEISRGKTGRMYGNLTAMLTICKGLPMTYNRDLQEDKEPLFDSLDTAEGILSVYPEMIATMKTKPEKMLQAATDPGLMATDLAEALVKKGIPFRNAHHMVGALVRYCGDNGKAMDKLYKIEESLKNLRFSRISKTVIANLDKMLSIRKAENSRLTATLVNQEKLIVSRQYVSEIKKKLGV